MSSRRVTVRAKPHAKERSCKEVGPDLYEIRTTEAPDRGRANEDIVDLLADHLGVPKSSIALVRGGSGKTKIFEITA